MDKLRKDHNSVKETLINRVTSPGNTVLDVGCGFGGDFHKWNRVGARVHACDPSNEAIREANSRIAKCKMSHIEKIWVGDIHSCKGVYDIICYNFSIHYAFNSALNWEMTAKRIRQCAKKGTFLIGTVFDSNKLLYLEGGNYEDQMGNKIQRDVTNTGYGKYGEYINVFLSDTPYFKGNFIPEPIAYKDHLVHELCSRGFQLIEWKSLFPIRKNTISDLYSQFIFKCL